MATAALTNTGSTASGFFARHNVPDHWPQPLALTLGECRALARMPADLRSEEIARLAHDDFLGNFPALGLNALNYPALEKGWQRHCQAYLTAAFASYFEVSA